MNRRVLMVSPFFPPETGAAAHRVRLLAPHLPKNGWEPVVLTIDPRDYEGRLDHELAALVPGNLQVVRCRAWPVRLTRPIGFGDLGLRAFHGLYRSAKRLLARGRFEALFVTVFPMYPALLGPALKRSFNIPFVLDYIDPWVSAWGLTTGGGLDGTADLKSKLSRRLGVTLEPIALRATDAITAVSQGTYEQILERNPGQRGKLCREIPYGGEKADFDAVLRRPRPNGYFDPHDGQIHLSYVGTMLPLGFETLRALLSAFALMRDREPNLYGRTWLHFFGTSNQTSPSAPETVMPVAREIGVSRRVTEIAPRIDYIEALLVQSQSSGILMMGSSEPHYTASKLYPGLLARRPILAVYHNESSVVRILRQVAPPPVARVVAYDDRIRAQDKAGDIYHELRALAEHPAYDSRLVNMIAAAEFSAEAMARRLASVLDAVAEPRSLEDGNAGTRASILEGVM